MNKDVSRHHYHMSFGEHSCDSWYRSFLGSLGCQLRENAIQLCFFLVSQLVFPKYLAIFIHYSFALKLHVIIMSSYSSLTGMLLRKTRKHVGGTQHLPVPSLLACSHCRNFNTRKQGSWENTAQQVCAPPVLEERL